jgi:2-amino-4-hydroxy-6-hydroxymethyldihydropteridine diphosphokinase
VLIHCEQLGLVALGANLPLDGDAPETTLSRALASLVANGFPPVAVSRFFRTPCFPAGAGPDYVNAACSLRISAETSPPDLLALLHRIEDDFGRKRHFRWGMRTLDLDLVAFGDSVFPDAAAQTLWRDLPAADQARLAPDQLILPHPRLQDRAFVLIPLADIAPDWCHPLLGLTVAQMVDRLDPADRVAIRPIPR